MRSFIHVLALGGSDRLMPVVKCVFTARLIVEDALTKEKGGTAGTLFQPERIRVSFSKRTGRKGRRDPGEDIYNATRGGGYPLDRHIQRLHVKDVWREACVWLRSQETVTSLLTILNLR